MLKQLRFRLSSFSSAALVPIFTFLYKHYLMEIIILLFAIAGLFYALDLYKEIVGAEERSVSTINIFSLDGGYSIRRGQIQIIRRRSKPDELVLKMELIKSSNFNKPTSLFKIITDAPLVSAGSPGFDIEQREVWEAADGAHHRVYAIAADKDDVTFLQSLKGAFFDEMQGQVTLSLGLSTDQRPTPPIAAYFYVGDIFVSSISPKPEVQLPEGGKPQIIGFEDAVSKQPNRFKIEILGADVAKLRKIQGDTFRIGILAGVITSLFAGAMIEILRKTLKFLKVTS